MGRPFNIERSVILGVALPESVRTKLDLLLWSEVEQRVPRGAYQAFFVTLLNEYFDRISKPPERKDE